MGTIQPSYAASAAINFSTALNSLASDSGLKSGAASDLIDNTSGQYLDRPVSGQIKVGSGGITAGTQIEIWVLPKLGDATYFSALTGSAGSCAFPSRGALTGYGRLLARLPVDVTTANAFYPFVASIVEKTGILPPKFFQLFVVHNTGANLASSGHVFNETGQGATD